MKTEQNGPRTYEVTVLQPCEARMSGGDGQLREIHSPLEFSGNQVRQWRKAEVCVDIGGCNYWVPRGKVQVLEMTEVDGCPPVVSDTKA